MGSRRQRSAIDAVTRVISQVQEALVEEKLTCMILMDIKEVFDYVKRNCLLRTMEGMGADKDLMRWKESFMSDTSISLVIDVLQSSKVRVETRVPQRSPMSPILFAIYPSSYFTEVEKELKGCTATSFANDCKRLVTADSVEQLCQ